MLEGAQVERKRIIQTCILIIIVIMLQPHVEYFEQQRAAQHEMKRESTHHILFVPSNNRTSKENE